MDNTSSDVLFDEDVDMTVKGDSTYQDRGMERTESRQPHSLEKCKSELLILGTGSAMPSKYRNVSSMLLYNIEGGTGIAQAADAGSESYGHMLLDCGEGTYGQMWNFCKGMELQKSSTTFEHDATLQALNATLRKIQVIWISHKHADHLLGLPQIIFAR